MKRSTALIRILVGPVFGIFMCMLPGVQAQDMLEIEIADVEGTAGELVEIPVFISTDQDSLAGFEIDIVLDRSDIVYFEVDTVVVDLDTSYICDFDTSGMLISGWGYVEARCLGGGGTNIKMAGLHWLFTGEAPIGTYTSGTLMKFFARVRDDLPAFIEDSTVILMVSGCYSNPQGGTISPVNHIDGSVTMVAPACDCLMRCDMDGVTGYTPVDVAYIINYVYKQRDARPELPNCPGANGDWNCDGVVTPLDVSWYVRYVYKSSAVGPCNPCACDPYPSNCPAFL